MQEAWIQLYCPDCEEYWEANVNSLPGPDTQYTCDGCGRDRPLSEFMRTGRDLEVLREFTE